MFWEIQRTQHWALFIVIPWMNYLVCANSLITSKVNIGVSRWLLRRHSWFSHGWAHQCFGRTAWNNIEHFVPQFPWGFSWYVFFLAAASKVNHGPDDHSDAASDSPLVHLNNVSGGPHEITFSLVFCNSLQHLLGTSIHCNAYRANFPQKILRISCKIHQHWGSFIEIPWSIYLVSLCSPQPATFFRIFYFIRQWFWRRGGFRWGSFKREQVIQRPWKPIGQ